MHRVAWRMRSRAVCVCAVCVCAVYVWWELAHLVTLTKRKHVIYVVDSVIVSPLCSVYTIQPCRPTTAVYCLLCCRPTPHYCCTPLSRSIYHPYLPYPSLIVYQVFSPVRATNSQLRHLIHYPSIVRGFGNFSNYCPFLEPSAHNNFPLSGDKGVQSWNQWSFSMLVAVGPRDHRY